MRYYVELQKNSQSFHTLEFDIFDTPITRIWSRVFDYVSGGSAVGVPDATPQQVLTPGSVTKLYHLWQLMVDNVDAANACGGYFDQHPIQISRHVEYNTLDYYKLDQELNYLHWCFHDYEEKLLNQVISVTGADALPALRKLNVLIHNVEHCVRSLVYNNQDIMLGFKPGKPNMIGYGETISDKTLYQYWDEPWQSGDLVLGYATTGKNLWICHRDNDVDLVRNGMLRPQTAITSEARLQCFKHEYTVEYLNDRKQQMEQWVIDNHLDQYIDCRAPEHWLSTEPRLGHILGNPSIDEMAEIVTDDVSVRKCWLEK